MSQHNRFRELVQLKYQIFNSLFLTLPFSKLGEFGAQLPMFAQECQQGLEKGEFPEQIVLRFLERVEPKDRYDVLFLFLQLIERQVLLFDAVESAAYPELVGETTENLLDRLAEELDPSKTIRIVLTAHPTQFYPEVLLNVIQDLAEAVDQNDMDLIRKLLLQLGRTSFKNPNPPTPLDEALMLIDRFGQVLVNAFIEVGMTLRQSAPTLELGFWPGGDRDGNPNVSASITQKVCDRLREFARQTLLGQLEQLQRRITFKGLTEDLSRIKRSVREDLYSCAGDVQMELQHLLARVDEEHGGLFREEIERVLVSLEYFGFHFASLDLRQSSDVIGETIARLHPPYHSIGEEEKLEFLVKGDGIEPIDDDLVDVIRLVPKIQKKNGPKGLHRFVISHTKKLSHLLEVFALSRWFGEGRLDVVPLFESIEDMRFAPQIMGALFDVSVYRDHLADRGMEQVVMLGFSDGTKDGGYITCNTEIQKCKENLIEVAKDRGVNLVFFDGRGGPPARGGGSTHRYYAAVAEKLPFDQIQLTVQGQSISSYYGNLASAKHNLAQLLAAFLTPKTARDDTLIEEIGACSHRHYLSLKERPDLIQLLERTTPLNLLGDLNIASRPPKRPGAGGFSLESLRAISFVGAWSLMKVNVPAFYGFGLGLEELIDQGKLESLRQLYRDNLFFQVLVGNSAQALRKSYLPLTQYTESDPQFGGLWKSLRDEAKRTREKLQQVAEDCLQKLDDPISEASIALREQVILPLLVIQHHALVQWQKDPQNEMWRKLLLKSIAPSINASRNSA